MEPDALRQAVRDVRAATTAPFGVNIPLMRQDKLDLIGVCEGEQVGVIITSSGDPSLLTPRLKNSGRIVMHVVATVKHARKAEDAGCDVVIAEGFEAGGHNGVDEITTLALVPQVSLVVHKDNYSAIAVYRKIGFTKVEDWKIAAVT